MSELTHKQVEANGLNLHVVAAGSGIPVLRPEMTERMSEGVPNLRETVLITGCGHWTQQERPDEVNQALIGFFKTVTP